jgi:hypothetical protein
MAGPAGNGARRFEVHCSGAVTDVIRRVIREALRQGRGEIAAMALREIINGLQSDPFHAGESTYRLPGLRMQVRTVAVRPLIVDFAVCEDRPLVFIKGVKLLSSPSVD